MEKQIKWLAFSWKYDSLLDENAQVEQLLVTRSQFVRES